MRPYVFGALKIFWCELVIFCLTLFMDSLQMKRWKCFEELKVLSEDPSWPQTLRFCLDVCNMQPSCEIYVFHSLKHTVGDELASRFFLCYASLCDDCEIAAINAKDFDSSTNHLLTSVQLQSTECSPNEGEGYSEPIACRFCTNTFSTTDAALKHCKRKHIDKKSVIKKGDVSSYSSASKKRKK